jgi:phosphoribosylanthranilate isomerase
MIIKVCGLREADDLRGVEGLAVDWTGFVFHPPSPRYVPDTDDFAEAVRKVSKRRVGVFVNADMEEIARRVRRFALESVQLHGDEPPKDCAALRDAGCLVIKAFGVTTEDDLRLTEAYEGCVDYFLFDTKCATHGGSGRRFDWQACRAYRGRTPFLLSGGIRPEDVGDLHRFAHPLHAGIDLNSGFETAPAHKDIDRLRQFIRQIRINK